ncbi:MAG: hypothetical protein ABSH09_26385 [Bryobacteraceae bacterium]|jgi:hypothetical protein
MERLDQELDSLFAAYRDAVPDPDASPDFMPRLWGRIEAQRSFVYRLRRMAQIAVAAAAVACLLGGVLFTPVTKHEAPAGSTYVDILAEAQPEDVLATTGMRLDLLDTDQH